MRIVVDTNVLVSAVLKANSLPFQVVRWIDRHGGLLKSAATEQEILNVLARPHIATITIPSFRAGLAGLLAESELVTIVERITACRDPADDKFLELAVNGRADLIVSGNRDLLALDPFRRVPILTPIAKFCCLIPIK
jgi:putative PIN family toxin of toxin-antitoxin system